MSPGIRKLVLYVVIGIAAALIDYSTFYILRRKLELALLLANTSGVCSGIAFSFFANRSVNFRVFDRVSVRFFRFATVAGAGLAASNALLYGLTALDIRDTSAKAISIFIIGACQFLVNNLWTFSVKRRIVDISETGLQEAD
jgi:putative flippase GtrA